MHSHNSDSSVSKDALDDICQPLYPSQPTNDPSNLSIGTSFHMNSEYFKKLNALIKHYKKIKNTLNLKTFSRRSDDSCQETARIRNKAVFLQLGKDNRERLENRMRTIYEEIEAHLSNMPTRISTSQLKDFEKIFPNLTSKYVTRVMYDTQEAVNMGLRGVSENRRLAMDEQSEKYILQILNTRKPQSKSRDHLYAISNIDTLKDVLLQRLLKL